jgi:hypothetical protein
VSSALSANAGIILLLKREGKGNLPSRLVKRHNAALSHVGNRRHKDPFGLRFPDNEGLYWDIRWHYPKINSIIFP